MGRVSFFCAKYNEMKGACMDYAEVIRLLDIMENQAKELEATYERMRYIIG